MKAAKARQIQNARRIAHSGAFVGHSAKPRAFAVPCALGVFAGVIAGAGIPSGTLPSVIGRVDCAQGFGLRVNGREFLIAAFGPRMVREVDGVFVAIHFHALFHAIVRIFKARESARIARPHIPFGRTFGDPFGQDLSRATRLADAKGENARLKRIGHTGHRADQRVAIGGVGDRAVDHLGQGRLFQQGHTRHSIGDVPFQTFQIVGEQLEAEILREGIVGRCPMGFAIALVRAKVEAVLFLPQVVAAVDIAQQGQFVAHILRPLFQFGDRIKQHILMAHHHHGQITAKPFAHLAGIIACGVDHDFAANVALGRGYHPFIAFTPHTCGGAEAFDARAHLARALGQGLGQLSRINVAVIGVVQSAG